MSHRCGGCGSTNSSHAFTGADLALGALAGTFAYRSCRACGSVFASPQPSDSQLAAAYAQSYGNYQPAPSALERAAAPLALPEVRRFMRGAARSGSLIELGAGNGRFLERLQRCGWEGPLQGLEFDADVAAAAAARTGVEFRVGNLNELALPENSYDAIVMRHVIEHVRRPLEVLCMVARALRPGGILYLGTPDVRALCARAFGRHWWGYEIPRHLVIFSAPALESAVRAAGLEVVDRWSGFSPQMWSASLGLALADRAPSARWPGLVASPVNPFGLAVFSVASAVEVATGRSTMLSVVARRPAIGG